MNDGTALAAPVARECLLGWYGDNTPARGEWKVAGRKVHPETFDVPNGYETMGLLGLPALFGGGGIPGFPGGRLPGLPE